MPSGFNCETVIKFAAAVLSLGVQARINTEKNVWLELSKDDGSFIRTLRFYFNGDVRGSTHVGNWRAESILSADNPEEYASFLLLPGQVRLNTTSGRF